MKRVWDAVARIARSRIGNLLAVLNACILLYEFWSWGELAMSRFHFYTLSATFQFMLFINFPSILLSGVFLSIFHLLSEIRPAQSIGWVEVGIVIAIAAMQWQLIGYFIGRIVSKLTTNPAPLP